MGSMEHAKKRPRVLVLTSTFPRWPKDREPRFVYDLCRRLVTDFEIHVVAPHATGAARYEIMAGFHVHRFPYFPEKWEQLAYEGGILTKIRKKPHTAFQIPFFISAQILFARRLMNRLPFDAVHAHWILPQGLCAHLAQAGRQQRIPVLCTSHGGDLYGLRGPFFDTLRRWVLNRAAAVTAVSRVMADTLRASNIRTPCHVIPMGTDLTHLFTPDPKVPRRKATVLFVGRLVEKKGVRYLIKAFPYVLEKIPKAELWIVGSGPEERFLQELAASLARVDVLDPETEKPDPLKRPPRPGTITFFGAVPHEELPNLYRSATVTVVPSVVDRLGDQEGLGLVIVEAMGCGCPVIASDLPAIRDVVHDEETGMLVPSGKASAICEALFKVLDSPTLNEGHSLGQIRKTLENFDWSRIAARYVGLLNNVILSSFSHRVASADKHSGKNFLV